MTLPQDKCWHPRCCLPMTVAFLCADAHQYALQCIETIKAHRDDVNAVCFMDDSDQVLASGSDDTFCKVRSCCMPPCWYAQLPAPLVYVVMTWCGASTAVTCSDVCSWWC